MKQMRSRFRLITLLLVCAFLITLVLCTGSALKETGVSLPSLSSLQDVINRSSPEPSASPDAMPTESALPAPPEIPAGESPIPETDNSPVPEYNVYGL